MSTALGVYGTPQAVIPDGEGRLYYRGNYNRSRFCPQEWTEYVRLTLTEGRTLPPLPKNRVSPSAVLGRGRSERIEEPAYPIAGFRELAVRADRGACGR